MPFVNVDLLRGQSPQYLEAISNSVHEALVEGLGMKPEDRFQVFNQHDREEIVFNRDFRGGPRSDDFLVFTITDGWDRGEETQRKFYRALVTKLAENPGVNPADVFVKVHVTPPVNYSFAHGIAGSEILAREQLDASARVPGTRDAYTKTEMIEAIVQLFEHNDRSRILPMLRDDFVFTAPASLPYGGEYRGAKEFDGFFSRVVEEDDFYEFFIVSVKRIIDAGDHLVAQVDINAKGKTTGASMHIENGWVWDLADGNFTQAQVYADTGEALNTMG